MKPCPVPNCKEEREDDNTVCDTCWKRARSKTRHKFYKALHRANFAAYKSAIQEIIEEAAQKIETAEGVCLPDK